MKKIIHIDLDHYYSAIETRDNPEFANIPLAIGGSQYRRGVISTCNYIARQYGVHSAMSTAQAMKLCPTLTVISGNMEKYRSVSKDIHRILRRYTEVIEPLSLDEAYLDVTNSPLFQGSATRIAEDIRQSIKSELKLTASAGVAPLKFLAKIASDINKPDGIYVVKPIDVQAFIDDLDLKKIPGVGKVTSKKLDQMNLHTGKDIRQFNQSELIQRFGKFGYSLWQRCHGIDERQVIVHRERKSVGVEKTFEKDLLTEEECLCALERLFDELMKRYAQYENEKVIKRLGVKLKFSDFQQTTVESRYEVMDKVIYRQLLQEAIERQNGRGIRLIGINVGIESKPSSLQLSLDF
ncbi:DNA polymerase IV [Vibrio sp.]|nr:DNA polymerase IV [Vibrio sp.]